MTTKDLHNKYGNKTGFSVPDSYFDTFDATLKLDISGNQKESKNRLRPLYRVLAVAAAIIVFFLVYNPFAKETQLEVADVEAWIEDDNLNLSTYEIALLLDDEDLDFENDNE